MSTTTARPRASASRPPSRRRGRTAFWLVALLGLGGAAYAWTTGHVADVVVHEQCTATAKDTTTTLVPERMGNAAIIAGISVKRGLPARAASIGLAAALQESKLDNLDYGDRDSLGLFQQRPSQGWGTAAEVRDPVYATNAFYDVLVKIEGYQALEITKAAQKVQRSGYPEAYADHEDDGRALASTLTGYTRAGLTCVLKPVAGSASRKANTPGEDGLTASARRVVAAAGNEATGRLRRPLGVSGDTSSLLFTTSGGDKRLAWSLAQWAVARAAGLDIVQVEVDGRRWDRVAPGKGWSTVPADADGVRPGPGEVLITVANR